MSNEKLREALQEVIAYARESGHDWLCLTEAEEALATTAPEPTGMPELHPVAHIELGDDSHDVVTLEAAKAYGEQCWKAGYKYGAWGDKPEPTSKQSLQVEPAVNQQLTTEPVADLSDDMGSLADYFGDLAQQKADLDASRGVSMPVSYYASTVVAAALAWQARAAMAKGVKG